MLKLDPAPEGADVPEWAGSIWDAWHALRDDRHFGAMGGLGRIYYRALSGYAADHGVAGEDFAVFRVLVMAMDSEFIEWSAERDREEAERRKREQT